METTCIISEYYKTRIKMIANTRILEILYFGNKYIDTIEGLSQLHTIDIILFHTRSRTARNIYLLTIIFFIWYTMSGFLFGTQCLVFYLVHNVWFFIWYTMSGFLFGTHCQILCLMGAHFLTCFFHFFISLFTTIYVIIYAI